MHIKRGILFILLLVGWALPLLAQDDDLTAMLSAGAQPVTPGDLLLEQDFASGEGWTNTETERRFLSVDDGQYRIEHSTRNSPIRALYDEESFDNTVIVVETTQLSDETDNGYGVVCRADPDVENSGFYFLISGDGFARIFTYDNFRSVDLAPWAPLAFIEQGQSTNELVAVCDNTYLALYVNGQLALEANSDAYTEGQVGFVASTYVSQTPVNIAYDNLSVYSSSGEAGAIVGEMPELIKDYGGDWTETIAELEALRVIASGGQLIFSENRAFMDGTIGAEFYPLASSSNHADVIFGGEMTITLAEDDSILCGFMSRVQLNASGTSSVSNFEASIMDMESVLVSTVNREELDYELVDVDLPLDEPVHMLYILQDDRASVYINGELVITDFEIFDVSGFHGIVLRTLAAGGRCEGNNMWAYSAPVFQAGRCEASAGGDVNQRTGPGTNFDRAGTLAGGTTLRVIGQATGTDSFVWWQLENENWVREDVVNVAGDCASIPEVEG